MAQMADPIQYQYRTREHVYIFKTTEDFRLRLKIKNLSETVLFKESLPLREFKPSPLEFNERVLPKILSVFIDKAHMPPELLPSASHALLPPAPYQVTPAAAPPAPPKEEPPPPAEPSLDAETLAKLRALAQESQTRIAQMEALDQEGLRVVAANPASVRQLIESRKKEEQTLGELSLIQGQPHLYKYYQTFYQKLTGICQASYTIRSGMVENAQQNAAGQFGQLLSSAGDTVPVIGTPLKILGALFNLKNVKDNNQAVRSLLQFFSDFEQSLRDIKTLARLLAREQASELLKLVGQTPGRVKKAMTALSDWFTAEESSNPVAVKAIKDIETLLLGVLMQKLPPQSPPEHIAIYILGRPLSPPSSLLMAPSPTSRGTPASAPSPMDAATKEEVRSLQETIATLQAQVTSLLAEKAKGTPKKAGSGSSEQGGGDGQLQVQLDDDEDGARRGAGSVQALRTQVATLTVRLTELQITAREDQESATALARRVDKLEQKKK